MTGLSILSLNIQSLSSKFSELQTIVNHLISQSCQFDVICLQETWLSENDNYNLYNLNGYKLYRKNLETNCSKHGGLITYINESLNVTNTEVIQNKVTFECIVSTIKMGSNRQIKIANMYRPPPNENRKFDDFINDFVPSILFKIPRNGEFILAGDFNMNLLAIRNDRNTSIFYDHLLNLNLLPKIHFPTHFLENTCTLIDNIFTKLSPTSQISNSGILFSTLSDHCPTFLTLDMNINKPCKPKYILSSNNSPRAHENFKRELESLDFDKLLDKKMSTDPNHNYNILSNIIVNLRNKHFPTTLIKFNKYKHKTNGWITHGILRSIKFRDGLYKRMKCTATNTEKYNTYKFNLNTYNKILKSLIKEAKSTFYENEFRKYNKNIKKTWDVIKSVINNPTSGEVFPMFIKKNDVTISNQKEIIEEFNHFFVNIGKNLATDSDIPYDSYSDYFSKLPNLTFKFKLVTEDEVLKKISNIQPKSSCGFDGISTNFLKKYSNVLYKPLTIIINQSLITGIFPDNLKTAKVIPIYKEKGLDINSLNSYRPISILPSISKIFEKIIYDQVYSHFTDFDLFHHSQYGFRTNHSTEHAIIELTEKIHKYLDKNITPIATFMDLSKAFDTINHSIMLHKLNKYGFKNTELLWFKSYLQNRKQYVSHDNSLSSSSVISTGVPQGSILGPLLFIIYINDLSSVSDSDTITYADDTCILSPFSLKSNFTKTLSSNIETINNNLNKIFLWLNANKLSLNITKTKCIMFHYKQNKITNDFLPKIQINHLQLEFVQQIKFLGINIDSNLSWESHINEIANKITKVNGILSKLKHVFPTQILLTIYNSLFLSRLTYGITAWAFGNCDRLKLLQKRAFRNITNSAYNAHSIPLCKRLNTILFDDIFTLACLKFYHKYKNSVLPKYFYSDNFISKYEHRRQSLRNMQQMIYPNYVTNLINYRPLFNIPKIKNTASQRRLRYHLPNLFNL